MIFDKFRMALDLEKIKNANIIEEENTLGKNKKSGAKEEVEKVGLKDFFAMVIAIFSLLLPYVAVFMGAIIIFGVLIMYLWK